MRTNANGMKTVQWVVLKRTRHWKKQARHWAVKTCHGWFNRFRKVWVRSENLEQTLPALDNFAAAIINLHKIMLPVNIIYRAILIQSCLGRVNIVQCLVIATPFTPVTMPTC